MTTISQARLGKWCGDVPFANSPKLPTAVVGRSWASNGGKVAYNGYLA